MSANRGTKRPDALLLRVMSTIHQTAEKPDPGFRTVEQWAKHWGVGRTQTVIYLKAALKAGLMETRPFRISTRANSKPYPIAHYGEKTRQRRK